MAETQLHLSPDILAKAEAAAARAGITTREWIERLVLGHAEEAEAAHSVGPEDEVRGGPEATLPPTRPTDD